MSGNKNMEFSWFFKRNFTTINSVTTSVCLALKQNKNHKKTTIFPPLTRLYSNWKRNEVYSCDIYFDKLIASIMNFSQATGSERETADLEHSVVVRLVFVFDTLHFHIWARHH